MNISKENAQKIVNNYGISKDYDQCGLTVNCVDDNKKSFTILQFNNNSCVIADFKGNLSLKAV